MCSQRSPTAFILVGLQVRERGTHMASQSPAVRPTTRWDQIDNYYGWNSCRIETQNTQVKVHSTFIRRHTEVIWAITATLVLVDFPEPSLSPKLEVALRRPPESISNSYSLYIRHLNGKNKTASLSAQWEWGVKWFPRWVTATGELLQSRTAVYLLLVTPIRFPFLYDLFINMLNKFVLKTGDHESLGSGVGKTTGGRGCGTGSGVESDEFSESDLISKPRVDPWNIFIKIVPTIACFDSIRVWSRKSENTGRDNEFSLWKRVFGLYDQLIFSVREYSNVVHFSLSVWYRPGFLFMNPRWVTLLLFLPTVETKAPSRGFSVIPRRSWCWTPPSAQA